MLKEISFYRINKTINKNYLNIIILLTVSFLLNNQATGQDLLITNNDDSIDCKFVSVDSLNYNILVVHEEDMIYTANYLRTSVKKLFIDFYIYKKTPAPIKVDTIKKFSYRFTDKIAETEKIDAINQIKLRYKPLFIRLSANAIYTNNPKRWYSRYLIQKEINLNDRNNFGVQLEGHIALNNYPKLLLGIHLSEAKYINSLSNQTLSDINKSVLATGTAEYENSISIIGFSFLKACTSTQKKNIFFWGGGVNYVLFSRFYKIGSITELKKKETLGYHLNFNYDRRINDFFSFGSGLIYESGLDFEKSIKPFDNFLIKSIPYLISASFSRLTFTIGMKYNIIKLN